MKTELLDEGNTPITVKGAARLIVRKLGNRARNVLLDTMLRRAKITGPIKDCDGDMLYKLVAWPTNKTSKPRRVCSNQEKK